MPFTLSHAIGNSYKAAKYSQRPSVHLEGLTGRVMAILLLASLPLVSKYEFISFHSFSDCLGWPRTVRTFYKAGDCNEGCQNPVTGLRAGLCQGNPLGAPSP